MTQSPQTLCPGQILLGKYHVLELVGEGGFAQVYHARSPFIGEVAVKVLSSGERKAQKRFERELRVLRALPPNAAVARYLDNGFTPSGWPFLVLEYVDGITLKEGMMRRGVLAPKEAVAFLAELCQAFVELHQLGVAHRDVKPENILLSREGQIKLIDFGLIRDAQGILELLEQEDPLEERVFGEELDRRILVGTPEYMAPEQFVDATSDDLQLSRTDTWSDVYSLGVILYQLISGEKPFVMREGSGLSYQAELLRYMRWRIHLGEYEVPFCPCVDDELQSIIRKALRQDPRLRQFSASELRDDLSRYLETGRGVRSLDDTKTQAIHINPVEFVKSLQTRVDRKAFSDSSRSLVFDEDDATLISRPPEPEVERTTRIFFAQPSLIGETGITVLPVRIIGDQGKRGACVDESSTEPGTDPIFIESTETTGRSKR